MQQEILIEQEQSWLGPIECGSRAGMGLAAISTSTGCRAWPGLRLLEAVGPVVDTDAAMHSSSLQHQLPTPVPISNQTRLDKVSQNVHGEDMTHTHSPNAVIIN